MRAAAAAAQVRRSGRSPLVPFPLAPLRAVFPSLLDLPFLPSLAAGRPEGAAPGVRPARTVFHHRRCPVVPISVPPPYLWSPPGLWCVFPDSRLAGCSQTISLPCLFNQRSRPSVASPRGSSHRPVGQAPVACLGPTVPCARAGSLSELVL